MKRDTLSASVVELYLQELHEIRSSGAAAKETSGYGTLANLFNAIGKTLRPRVRCLIQLRNSGAGMPDGGFFTPEQLRNREEKEPLFGHQPARGVIEVKGPAEDLETIVGTEQVAKYLRRYGQVLVTNYRDFLLLKQGEDGAARCLEAFHFAENETAFWNAARDSRKTAADISERFSEYIKRVLLHAAPLNSARDIAFFLGSYARDAHVRVENAGQLPALAAMRSALEEALGMKFEGTRGEHFFRSTLVQTIFYGVFSAWVLWHKENPHRKDAFDWRTASWTLHVPMVRSLFEQLATPTKLAPLGLIEVLDWTAAALNRVDRAVFFEKFIESYAVQYFYEPFLEAFDPELRKQLGVWYTPPEIVKYMVARADTALRDELGIADGLADPRVFVLDPCCGTGAYLVEVLQRIVKTLKEEKGEGALAELAAKEAVQTRVFGFEIMPAPFVVAHLKIGLLLQNLGVPLDDAKQERAGVFLTNSLTGWDFAGENPHLKNWPELEAERAGAGRVKQEKPILVILGNPPYNAYAGVSPDEERGMVEPYKEGLTKDWGIKKFNLDDLYVRFFRLAERRIAERTGNGIVCYISNFSYLGNPSFVRMRQRFLKEFDSLWFDCLNGDSRETGKLTPEGNPDPSVFSTDYNREGIRVGTVVGLMVRQPKRTKKPRVLFRHFWGTRKREELVESLSAEKFSSQYEIVQPQETNRFSFRPSAVAADYLSWPNLAELCAVKSDGLFEKRNGALIDHSRNVLEKRMRGYYDPNVSWDELKASKTGLSTDVARFSAKKAREKILRAESFTSEHLRRYCVRPFDVRWCYYSAVRPLWNEPRPLLWSQAWPGNAFLVSRLKTGKTAKGSPIFYSPHLVDGQAISVNPSAIPIRLRQKQALTSGKRDDGNHEFGSIMDETAISGNSEVAGKATANLSRGARRYLDQLGIKNPDEDGDMGALLWMHALAVGYSATYLEENADGIRQDWPRIPLPDSKAVLLASARLGKQIAGLLDADTPVPGVSVGTLQPEMKSIAVLSTTTNLDVTAGWGHVSESGVTMPGQGKIIQRDYAEVEKPERENLAVLGASTYDVYLNNVACWRNIPANVWDYTVGGYQVLKKWLSYRERASLGRSLISEEAREVTHTARRLAGLLLLQEELNRNYLAVRAATVSWTSLK